MSALPSLIFQPHNGFGDNDPDGNPWPLGFITATFPIFEMQVVMDHPKMVEIATAMAAAPDMLAALRYVLTRCVSEAAYPHASIEDRKMRDMVVAAIATAEGRPHG
jgi:hypothetical protein